MTRKLGLDCHKLWLTENYANFTFKTPKIVSYSDSTFESTTRKQFQQLQLANANAKCSVIINNQLLSNACNIEIDSHAEANRRQIYNYKCASTL